MKKTINQVWKFILVSGIGYLLDWLLYFILLKMGLAIQISNFISMTLAGIYVFFLSSKKIFKNENSKLDTKIKYVIYIVYQIILITISSYVIVQISSMLTNIFNTNNLENFVKYTKYFAKIINTPITLLINFFVVKNLIEKI